MLYLRLWYLFEEMDLNVQKIIKIPGVNVGRSSLKVRVGLLVTAKGSCVFPIFILPPSPLCRFYAMLVLSAYGSGKPVACCGPIQSWDLLT